jgi:2-C-methyl-D-erythritol 4-phosphate cytidylyltransferase
VSGPVVALVLAAGQGTRLGRGPKAALELGGRPLAAWSLGTLGSCAAVDRVVLVGDEATLAPALASLSPAARGKVARVVAGGASREESCALGLADAGDDAAIILVHDAARPFASDALFTAVARAAARTGAALAAVPLTDTLKRADERGRVATTIPRTGLWRAQTPQGARAELLRRAHAEAALLRGANSAAAEDGAVGTDDVALVERLGADVEIVPGEAWNLKLTSAEDLAWAEAWLGSRATAPSEGGR